MEEGWEGMGGPFSGLYHVLQSAKPSARGVPWLQKSHVLLTSVQTGKEKPDPQLQPFVTLSLCPWAAHGEAPGGTRQDQAGSAPGNSEVGE